ncbi:MAG: nuclear transport factor 2 family protein [Myxococcota bacterium]
MTDANLTDRLARLEALEEIKALKHRYFRAMTLGDYDLLEETLTEDVSTSYSDGEYVFDDREKLLRFLIDSHHAGQQVAYWMCGMPEIEVTSQTDATGIWAFYHYFYHRGHEFVDEMFAYYDDVYRYEDGAWRIAKTGYKRVLNQELYRKDLPYKVKVPAGPVPQSE